MGSGNIYQDIMDYPGLYTYNNEFWDFDLINILEEDYYEKHILCDL